MRDAIKSVVDDFDKKWRRRRISVSILGDLSLLINVEKGFPQTATERSVITIDRIGEDEEFAASTVSVPAEEVTKLLQVIFDSYRSIRDEAKEEPKGT